MVSKHRIGIALLLVVTLVLTSSLLAAGQSETFLPLVVGNESSTSAQQDSPGAQETPEVVVVEEAAPAGESVDTETQPDLTVADTVPLEETVTSEPLPAGPPEDTYAEGTVAPAEASQVWHAFNWNVQNRVGIGTQFPSTNLDVFTGGAGGAHILAGGHAITLRGVNNPAGYLPVLPYIQWRQGDNTRAMYLGWGNTTPGSRRIDMALENGYKLAITGGRVGIGTATPQHTLSVSGGPLWTSNGWVGAVALSNVTAIGWQTNTAGQRFGMGHTNSGFYMFRTASNPGTAAFPAIYDLAIRNNGFVGIGTTNPGVRLDVNGSVRAVSFIATSDARYKMDVTPLTDALDTVLALRGVSYLWDQEAHPEMSFAEGRQLGFIAQEVESVLPEVVEQDEQGMYSVNYNGVTPVLVEAVKEQQSIIEQQEAEIDGLEAQLDQQQTEIDALKVQMEQLMEQLVAQQK